MSNKKRDSLPQRLADFLRLVRSMVSAGHDIEALDAARTILDRSTRPFAFDGDVTKPGAVECNPDEFQRSLDLLKWMEGPDGAAFDGGGPEADLSSGGRRFGTTGMPRRRLALINASAEFAQVKNWVPVIREAFSDADSRWRWRESGWFHGQPIGDVASLLFQPLVILVAPGRGALERNAAVLEQLLPPPDSIPVSLARAGEKATCAPYAALALLDCAEPNPAAAVGALQALVDCRHICREAGWPVADIEVAVLGGNPVWFCALEWFQRGERAGEFGEAWAAALREEGPLSTIYRGTTVPDCAAAVVELVTGEKPGILLSSSDLPPREERGRDVHYTLTCEEKMHLFAERLRSRLGESDVEVRIMDRVRRLDPARVPLFHLAGIESVEVSGAVDAVSSKWASRPEAGEVYVFPHIPKTAGSSVHFHLKTHMAYDREYIHIPIDHTANEDIRSRTPFTLRNQRDRHDARVIFGHGVMRRHADFVPDKRPLEIITLRDPVERLLSHYNFWMNVLEKRGDALVSFEQWYAGEPRNYHLNWIAKNYLDLGDVTASEAFQAAKDALENFWLVCTLPTFDEDIAQLWMALDLPAMHSRQNVSGVTHEKRFECDELLRQRLLEENALDQELYAHWLTRNRARHAAATV